MPQVPFPQGQGLDEGALSFTGMPPPEKVITPDHLKMAAGMDEELPRPVFPSFPPEKFPEQVQPGPSRKMSAPEQLLRKQDEPPMYLKVEVYQRILGEIDRLRTDFVHLNMTNQHLTNSEYNEENNFTKLRRAVRGMHDRLLQVDKALFKHQGE